MGKRKVYESKMIQGFFLENIKNLCFHLLSWGKTGKSRFSGGMMET